MSLTNDIKKNKELLQKSLPIEKSFDVIGRELILGDRSSYLVFIDGFAKDDVMLWLIKALQEMDAEQIDKNTIQNLIQNKIAYLEVESTNKIEDIQKAVLSGALALVVDKEKEAIIIDAREYPVRGPQEPDLEKVTRGSRDGLVETVIFNTALIRRRVRDPKLIFEISEVGKRSKSDVVLAYIDGLADKNLIDKLNKKLKEIDVGALVMAEKTLEELLIKKKWYNPFPQVRFSERPDVVSAHLLEGHVAIIVDTSPSVMILPVTMFHFTQHAEDYYQNILVGTFIRWIRFLGMFASFLLLPLWLVLVHNKEILPEFLQFIGPKDSATFPLFFQFILLELGFDLLRVSSIHTPNTLSTSLGIIGGLLLSEFAVKVGFFVPETILYMAVAGIGTFATPSIEFAMAIRIFRLLLLLLTGLFKTSGFVVGIILTAVILFTTKTFDEKHRYTWPLFPFDGKALSRIIFRKPIPTLGKNDDK